MFILKLLILFAMLATATVLALGVLGMMRRSQNALRSNKLMRLRLIFQAAALVFLVLTVWMHV